MNTYMQVHTATSENHLFIEQLHNTNLDFPI